MITLKLATYSQEEANKLAELLVSMQPTLHEYCVEYRTCNECPIRHLCVDVSQATLYAEEYEAVR